MDDGAIDLHKKDSQIRIVTEDGEVLDRRTRRPAIASRPCSKGDAVMSQTCAERMRPAGAGGHAARS
jgi:hypothetical protein